ncbi:DUF3967 domain-containing protein (plasmid) [Brevibacillus laterosporus]|nr:DUF3967 domain-containing protein [Brevibacillus laterosporus]TPG65779.1 DUF3967 domain-containing protein [Brevibacillus laterosporus]
MDNGFERTYWANDVAELLGISTSALRKWSLRLEGQGYCIIRDENDRRAYRERDLIAFRTMKDFLDKKMSMENASKAVYTMYSSQLGTDEVQTSVLHTNRGSNERLLEIENKFIEYMEQQKAFNQALLDQLQKRDEYIENALKLRDERLMQSLNEIMETKKLIAVAQEQPKKKWYQFWK